jgi:hypothetical protein
LIYGGFAYIQTVELRRHIMSSNTGNPGLRDLDRLLQQIGIFRKHLQPRAGWLRATRLYSRLSAGDVARRMGVCRQLPLQFEKAEADDSITLRSLRAMASALGYELVYVLVPKIKQARPVPEKKEELDLTRVLGKFI